MLRVEEVSLAGMPSVQHAGRVVRATSRWIVMQASPVNTGQQLHPVGRLVALDELADALQPLA